MIIVLQLRNEEGVQVTDPTSWDITEKEFLIEDKVFSWDDIVSFGIEEP